MKKSVFILLGCLCIMHWTRVSSQSVSLTIFASGLSSPLDIKHAGDSRLFVVEQAGTIRIIDSLGIVKPVPFLDIQSQIQAGGEQGLLGLAFHPQYSSNGYFFVNYTDLSGHTHISRFQVSSNPDIANAASQVNLMTIRQPYNNHNGGNMMFGRDGYLYINLGDGGSAGDPANRAQNTDTLLGKILRINVDVANPPYYSSPAGNPFAGPIPGRDEIWALGLRNPWRSSFDRITGDLWIADVGQNAWEEIDFLPAGSAAAPNFGWRCYEGNATYNTSGCSSPSNYIFPVYAFDHNTNNDCSVTGGFVYRGGQWGDLFGYYFFEDYCSGIMRTIRPDGSGGWIVQTAGNFSPTAFSSFGEDRYGELYASGLNNGNIYKISGTTCKPTAAISCNHIIDDTIKFCKGYPVLLEAVYGQGLTYSWQLNGVPIAGASSDNYIADSAGLYTVVVTNASSCTNTSQALLLLDSCSVNGGIPGVYGTIVYVYPLPFEGKIVISSKVAVKGVIIYDLKGDTIWSDQIYRSPGSFEIALPSGSKGVKLVKILTGKESYIRKVVIE